MFYIHSIGVLSLLCSLSASAQTTVPWDYNLDDDMAKVTTEVKTKGPTLSLDQKTQIATQIKAIRAIIGSTGTQSNFACVSRGNDGRSPYMLAASTGTKMLKVNGTSYQKNDDCNSALTGMRETPLSSIVCTSRDGDGRSPWNMGIITQNNTYIRLNKAVSNTLETCQAMVTNLIIEDDAINALYCSSKNGDGRSPYAVTKMDLRTGANEIGSNIFGDLAQCNRNLGIFK
jgi:hypothetical protein